MARSIRHRQYIARQRKTAIRTAISAAISAQAA
jgi:hypothetical protein